MLPESALSISSSLGFLLVASSTAADIICPGWQYPHCATCSSIQAFWTGWLLPEERPSIVVPFFPATRASDVTHERTAFPSTTTVHAPQWAIPHPNFVPVRPSESLRTQRSGVLGASFASTLLPLIVNLIAI